MSKRIILMERKIEQAKRAGKSAGVVRPSNLKRVSLVKLFEYEESKKQR